MSQENNSGPQKPQLIASTRPYFVGLIENAIAQRQVKSPPPTQVYLVDLLEFYLHAQNFSDRSTLAEMFLIASNSAHPVRSGLLKKLGDVALYTSGFFGDSLNRKLVDIDYYAEIGGTAYNALAQAPGSDYVPEVFEDLANQFLKYVDVLTYISQQALVQTNEDLLRLYGRYLSTGSKLAEQQLIERGVLNLTNVPGKSVKQ